MGEVLWRLCRPVVLLALMAGGALLLAMGLMQQATGTSGLLVSVASILAGVALLAAIVAVAEFFLALLAWQRWMQGQGKRCPVCDAPWSPSMVWPDRCTRDAGHRKKA